MLCSDLHEWGSCSFEPSICDFGMIVQTSLEGWFCVKACVCLHVPVFHCGMFGGSTHMFHICVWHKDCRLVQRFPLFMGIIGFFLPVFDMSLFIHACAMISVCQKDLIREHARWRHNFAPSQSDLEVLSMRSIWDVWAFIFLFCRVMFDKESPISCFFVMSTVFVSFFDSDHYLFWNGRVVWHIVPGTHSFVQHVVFSLNVRCELTGCVRGFSIW